jgi:hypothetical protein
MRAPVLKCQSRASHQIAHRLRDEHFAWSRKTGNACANMHGNACKIVTQKLAFPGVQAAAYFKVERLH